MHGTLDTLKKFSKLTLTLSLATAFSALIQRIWSILKSNGKNPLHIAVDPTPAKTSGLWFPRPLSGETMKHATLNPEKPLG